MNKIVKEVLYVAKFVAVYALARDIYECGGIVGYCKTMKQNITYWHHLKTLKK